MTIRWPSFAWAIAGLWFAIIDADLLAKAIGVGAPLGGDGILYAEAMQAWLHGANPWEVIRGGFFFAAPPPTLLVMLPLAPLQPVAAGAVLVGLSLGASLFVVRRLKLPLVMLLFPPLVESTLVGGLDVLALAAILAGVPWLGALAKIYTAVPSALLGRWRDLVWLAVALALSALILPWRDFFDQPVGQHLIEQARHLSAWGVWPAMVVAAAALLLVGKDRAWLAVPALWPATHLHYAVIALPSVRSPLVAMLLGTPFPLAPVAAVCVAVVEQRIAARRAAAEHRLEVAAARGPA